MVELNEISANEIKKLLKKENKENWGIRIGVKAGGCSGLSYTMDIEKEPREKDKINESYGIRLFIDIKSYLFINGMVLEYSTDMIGGGFKFNNPNAIRSCSCGSSFNT